MNFRQWALQISVFAPLCYIIGLGRQMLMRGGANRNSRVSLGLTGNLEKTLHFSGRYFLGVGNLAKKLHFYA